MLAWLHAAGAAQAGMGYVGCLSRTVGPHGLMWQSGIHLPSLLGRHCQLPSGMQGWQSCSAGQQSPLLLRQTCGSHLQAMVAVWSQAGVPPSVELRVLVDGYYRQLDSIGDLPAGHLQFTAYMPGDGNCDCGGAASGSALAWRAARMCAAPCSRQPDCAGCQALDSGTS